MVKTLMYHKVQDFDTWKVAFDNFVEMRKKSGEVDFSVGTLQDESNTAYVINSWDSLDSFNAFVSSPELKDAMLAAGVLEPPHMIVLNELEKG